MQDTSASYAAVLEQLWKLDARESVRNLGAPSNPGPVGDARAAAVECYANIPTNVMNWNIAKSPNVIEMAIRELGCTILAKGNWYLQMQTAVLLPLRRVRTCHHKSCCPLGWSCSWQP